MSGLPGSRPSASWCPPGTSRTGSAGASARWPPRRPAAVLGGLRGVPGRRPLPGRDGAGGPVGVGGSARSGGGAQRDRADRGPAARPRCADAAAPAPRGPRADVAAAHRRRHRRSARLGARPPAPRRHRRGRRGRLRRSGRAACAAARGAVPLRRGGRRRHSARTPARLRGQSRASGPRRTPGSAGSRRCCPARNTRCSPGCGGPAARCSCPPTCGRGPAPGCTGGPAAAWPTCCSA